MPEVIVVRLSADARRFTVAGGEPKGKDHIYNVITRWPGWRRQPTPGKIGDRITGSYAAPISPLSAATLASAPLKVEWTPEAQNLADEQLKRLSDAREALRREPHGLVRLLPTERKPMAHQMQAMEAIVRLEGLVLLADDMGLGKTATSLWAMRELRAKRILVVCPASVKYNWAREIRETLDVKTFVIDGTPKRRADLFAELRFDLTQQTKTVVVINYDLLAHLSPEQFNLLRTQCDRQGLICDESHYLKNRLTTRTKLVTALAKGTWWRMLLSGTPVRNMVDDLFSQIDIIRPGSWTSYWDFAKRHLVITPVEMGTRKFNKVQGSKDVNGLNAVVNTMQIRRIKEDVLHLPPKIHTYPELELEGDSKKVYKAMKDLAILQLNELEGGMSIFSPQARSGVEAALRCEQIAQGFCGGVPEPLVEKLSKILTKKAHAIPGRPREVIFPEHPKVIWLMETIDTLLQTGKRPVILSRFNAPMFWLAAHYNADLILHGALSSKAKDETIRRFQDGEESMMFCQVKMAEGFNLHMSQDCIFLGRDWSPAINKQAEGRFHRIGQKGTVNIQIPLVRSTIEVAIHKRLMAKDADAEQALRTVTIAELKEAL